MKSDVEIAQEAKLENISVIANKISINSEALIVYGEDKAKINVDKLKGNTKNAKLVLVTAINPTSAGEGKSTTTVGIVDSLNKIGVNCIGCLREPSLGPVFGLKGGAAGGGYSQVVPMEDINLHFTGDMHALTSANNLICACIDNHIFQGNELEIDPEQILINRTLDINDRNLRNISIEKSKFSVERKDKFQITVASELMAILCLSVNISDLRERLNNILIGYNLKNEPIYLTQLNITGSIVVLLKDALKPNLVQTLENNPVLIHGGPFANIAHGCNSIIATKIASTLCDVVVTEAGFGADLGFEKFLNIKSRQADLNIDCVCLVVSLRAIKMHGEDIEKGFDNVLKHVETIKNSNISPLIVLNKFHADTIDEINELKRLIKLHDLNFVISDTFKKGSDGGLDMAQNINKILNQKSTKQTFTYDLMEDNLEKINKIVKEVYGAKGVKLTKEAEEKLKYISNTFNNDFYICMAKTPNSLTDDPKIIGRPKDFWITIKDFVPKCGANFLVCYAGDIMTMPGMNKTPNATRIDLDENNKIINLM